MYFVRTDDLYIVAAALFVLVGILLGGFLSTRSHHQRPALCNTLAAYTDAGTRVCFPGR